MADAPGFVWMNGYSGRGFPLPPPLAEELTRWTGAAPKLIEWFDPDRFGDRAA